MSTEIIIEFRNQLITFFDELICQFPQEGDLVVVRLFLTNQIPAKDIITIFNHKINSNDQELRRMIKERNENFLLEANLFSFLEKTKVNHFKRMWRSGNLDKEDKNIIWSWIDSFIVIADKYAKTI